MGNVLQFEHSPKTHKMKAFLLIFGLVAKEAFGIDFVDNKKITVDTRAPSTYQNCNCQCNSDTWTDGTTVKGNCRSEDRNGALFCYVLVAPSAHAVISSNPVFYPIIMA